MSRWSIASCNLSAAASLQHATSKSWSQVALCIPLFCPTRLYPLLQSTSSDLCVSVCVCVCALGVPLLADLHLLQVITLASDSCCWLFFSEHSLPKLQPEECTLVRGFAQQLSKSDNAPRLKYEGASAAGCVMQRACFWVAFGFEFACRSFAGWSSGYTSSL